MQFLSEEFVAEWAALERPLFGDLSALLVAKIDETPEGKVTISVEFAGGVIENAYVGSARGRDLELAMSYQLAAQLFRHEADPASEYMKGKLKMSGDMRLWLKLLPAWQARIDDAGPSELIAQTII
ncbi:MAG TPA: hypothetical protein DCX77_02805 [Acidimicrobiaceae bacterium]|nr:hypothetical protein [Acidimicrobiaceae bacterium]|tara:strand:- start:9 stop:386 length:378 start_codon:yes stop_codon:yes gene_type:complete